MDAAEPVVETYDPGGLGVVPTAPPRATNDPWGAAVQFGEPLLGWYQPGEHSVACDARVVDT